MKVEEGMSVTRILKNLGINENLFDKWKRAYLEDQQNAFSGKGRMRPEEDELMNLKKGLSIINMDFPKETAPLLQTN